MHLLLLITLFSSCVSSLVLQPLITPAPRLAIRDAINVCGYYSSGASIVTISCDIGTSCLVATYLSPAVAYCSRTDFLPVTTIYGFGNWPSDEGCGPGAACCPSLTPSVGEYLFDGGSTVLLGCSSTAFTQSAFTSSGATPTTTSPTAVPTFTTPGSTTDPLFGLTTTSASDSTATAATPPPSQTSTSKFSSTTTITVIVVGAVVGLIGGLVFLWLLFLAWKIHHKARHPQPQYHPIAYQGFQNSTASLHSGPPVKKKEKMGTWVAIATIVSPILAIVGTVVSIYFGLKQQK